jgi:hypothetical protein
MKWKFENIDIIFTCNESDFERTSNYSRNKLNTNDRIIYLDGGNIDGNDSVNLESDLLESTENIYDSNNVKPRRKASKVSDVLTVLGDDDSPIDY